MRLLFISLITTCVFSQDVLEDVNVTYTGKVVAIDSSYIAFIRSGTAFISVARHGGLHSVVLDSSETIIDKNGLKIGPDHRLWSNETRFLSGKRSLPLPEGTSELVAQQLLPIEEDYNPQWGKIGGVLIGISGGLGLYLLHSEYDGPEPTFDINTFKITYPQEYQDWEDKIETLRNMQYATLGAGGIMIGISIDF